MTTHKHEVEEAEQSMGVPPEAISVIKLTRADAVKLVAEEISELAAYDVINCEEAVGRCRDAFREIVVERARYRYDGMLSEMLTAVDKSFDALHSKCTYRVYEDGSDSGSSAQIIFSDHQQTYEARFRITVSLQLGATELTAAQKWRQALVNLAAARERDCRVGAMKKEARDLLVKAALDSSDEGAAVVAAVKALAKALKEKA